MISSLMKNFFVDHAEEPDTLGLFVVDIRTETPPKTAAVPLVNRRVSVEIFDSAVAAVSEELLYRGLDTPTNVRFRLPLPSRATLTDLVARFGDRTVTTRVKRTAAAQEEFDTAIAQGHSAVLQRKIREGLYELDIGNLNVHEECAVTFSYLQLLDSFDGEIEYRHPTTWVPPYASGSDSVAEMKATNPTFSHRPTYALSYSVAVSTAHLHKTLDRVECPYTLKTTGRPLGSVPVLDSAQSVSFQIGAAESDPSQDLSVRVSVRDENRSAPRPGGQAVVERSTDRLSGEEETHAMLVFQPSDPKLNSDHTTSPKEIIIIIDGSGSMGGDPIDQARRALEIILRCLPADGTISFNIVMYGSSHTAMFPGGSKPYSSDTLGQATAWIREHVDASYGGTEIFSCINDVFNMPLYSPSASKSSSILSRLIPNRSAEETADRYILFMTDGGVSEHEEKRCLDLCAKHPNASRTRIYTLGIGHGCRMALVEGMARCGRGVCLSVLDEDSAALQKKCAYISKCILSPGVSDLRLVNGSCILRYAPAEMPWFAAFDEPLVVFAQVDMVAPESVCSLRGKCRDGSESVTEVRIGEAVELQAKAKSTGIIRKLFAMAYIQSLEEFVAKHANNPIVEGKPVRTSFGLTVKQCEDDIERVSIAQGLISSRTSRVGVCLRTDPVDITKTVETEVPIMFPSGRPLFAPPEITLGGCMPRSRCARRSAAPMLSMMACSSAPQTKVLKKKKSSLLSFGRKEESERCYDVSPQVMPSSSLTLGSSGLPPPGSNSPSLSLSLSRISADDSSNDDDEAMNSSGASTGSAFDRICALCNYTGFWESLEQVCKIITVDISRVRSAISVTVSDEILATVLVLAWLRNDRKAKALDTNLLQEKANRWLKTVLPSEVKTGDLLFQLKPLL